MRLLKPLTLAAAAAVATATPAAAQVTMLSLMPGGVLFFDLGSVSKNGATAQAGLHFVVKTPFPMEREDGSGFHWIQRQQLRMEFDCREPRSRVLGTVMVDFGGAVVGPETAAQAWEPVSADSPGARARDLACTEPVDTTGNLGSLEVAMASYYRIESQDDAGGY
jgi:hypothetical protein